MQTIAQILRRVLDDPGGTRPLECPEWPPDAFAVTAILMDLTGAYARRRPETWSSAVTLRKIKKDASTWRRNLQVPRNVETAWKKITSLRSTAKAAADDEWCDAVHYILACADQACEGVGFSRDRRKNASEIELLYEAIWVPKVKDPLAVEDTLRRETLCLSVPASVACVQPKARTSQVGCTLRTLSHHLSLLPPSSMVRTCWFPLDRRGKARSAIDKPLNLLVVPFPYQIDGSCFRRSPNARAGSRRADGSGYFRIDQGWLPTGDQLKGFVLDLIHESEKRVNRIDGVILPELALDPTITYDLSLALIQANIEIFVTGVRTANRNALFAYFDHGSSMWTQGKHHRWRLDARQIRRYQLGHVLDPTVHWWEDIDLGEAGNLQGRAMDGARAVHFIEARPGAVACVLICEDLARHDPVHPVVRAVGPTFVIALLMDGPQLAQRWPGQYASVLADDPGSAVLTLTSLGMLRRSVLPGEPEPRVIALWKDASGDARQLSLPPKAHGLVLSLNAALAEEVTLDGRSDDGTTVQYTLGAVHSVKAKAPPPWAG